MRLNIGALCCGQTGGVRSRDYQADFLYSYGAPHTRARSARVELRYHSHDAPRSFNLRPSFRWPFLAQTHLQHFRAVKAFFNAFTQKAGQLEEVLHWSAGVNIVVPQIAWMWSRFIQKTSSSAREPSAGEPTFMLKVSSWLFGRLFR